MCEIVLWSTAYSRSCAMKWALNSRYFCTILTFGGCPGQKCWTVFSPCVWELAVFLPEHQYCHAGFFENSEFILVLTYMADSFGALNHLIQQMQGGGVNIIKAEEHLKAFQKKSSYGNDEQRIITSLIFLCWMTVYVRSKMYPEMRTFPYPQNCNKQFPCT